MVVIGTLYLLGTRSTADVVRARHGKYVLRIMYAAAQGKETTSETNLAEMLKINMPWLAGYDRRDALMIAELMDFFAGHTVDTSLDALVLSTFTHARLIPSPGDDTTGRSVRSWLEEIDIRFLASGQLQLFLTDPTWRMNLPSAMSSLPSAAAAEWLDRVLDEHAHGTRRVVPQSRDAAATAPDADTLFFRELRDHSWTLARGLSHPYCLTPAGTFWLRGSPTTRAGIEWCDLEWYERLEGSADDRFSFSASLSFFGLLAFNELLWPIVVILHAVAPEERLPLRIHQSYINSISIGLAAAFGAWLLQCRALSRTFSRHRRLGVPMRYAGRLEYAAIMAVLFWLQVQIVTSMATVADPLPGHTAITWIVRGVPTFCLLGVEILVSSAHAVAAACRYRDPRFLFEVTTNRANLRMRVC